MNENSQALCCHTGSCINRHLTCDSRGLQRSEEKSAFQHAVLGQLGTQGQKRKKRKEQRKKGRKQLGQIIYIYIKKTNSWWVIDLNLKGKTLMLLKNNIEECLTQGKK